MVIAPPADDAPLRRCCAALPSSTTPFCQRQRRRGRARQASSLAATYRDRRRPTTADALISGGITRLMPPSRFDSEACSSARQQVEATLLSCFAARARAGKPAAKPCARRWRIAARSCCRFYRRLRPTIGTERCSMRGARAR
jgi:hypothetical protein